MAISLNGTNAMIEEAAITFDDISLVPSFSDIRNRKECDIRTKLSTHYEMAIPIIAANMSSICEERMAIEMMNLGGVGAVHRFCTIERQCEMAKIVVSHAKKSSIDENSIWKTVNTDIPICFSIGAAGDYFERAQELLQCGVNVILIDIAHGHHIIMQEALEKLQTLRPQFDFDIIAGNIVTRFAAQDLIDWGANSIKVGIGGGSLCKTRIETGMGVPNLSALNEATDGIIFSKEYVPIICDGGIRNGGDISKSLLFGADSIMGGSVFAASDETPGEILIENLIKYKTYYGSASIIQKQKSDVKTNHIEGEYTTIECKGPVKNIVETLLDGVRSSMSYAGARTIEEFRNNTRFIRVTHAGNIEGHPHLLFNK